MNKYSVARAACLAWTAFFVLTACWTEDAVAELELHIDVATEEMYFLGTASGSPQPGFLSGNRIFWQEPSFVALNVTGVGVPVVGIEPPFLNFNVSLTSEALAMLSGELPDGAVDLQGNGERVDYSFMSPEFKAVIAESDGVKMELTTGAGFGPISVIIDPVSADQMIANLVTTVLALNINTGLSNSLDSKLQNAVDALDRVQSGDSPSAIGILYAFIQSVEAQRGKSLSIADADELVATAAKIIAFLDAS